MTLKSGVQWHCDTCSTIQGHSFRLFDPLILMDSTNWNKPSAASPLWVTLASKTGMLCWLSLMEIIMYLFGLVKPYNQLELQQYDTAVYWCKSIYYVPTVTTCTCYGTPWALVSWVIYLGLVDDMIGFQLDGKFYSKLRGKGAHRWQGSWCQHNAANWST